jgi:hypothetical protein
MNLKNTYHLQRQRISYIRILKLAAIEGINITTLLPGRAIVASAEGELTRPDAFSNNIILLYGMDGSP